MSNSNGEPGPQRVLCLGEALVDFVADVAGVSLIECPGFRKAAGGAVANVAAGLGRLGVPVAFLGKVGEDPFGRFLALSLEQAGVDTRWVCFDPAHRTGLAFVSLMADGERDFVFFRNPSADMLHQAKEVPEAALEGVAAYHFGSISLIQDPSREATLTTLRRARERGAFISFDPNLRPPLWPTLAAAEREIRTALPLADVVKLSAEEGEFLFGSGTPQEHAAQVMAMGPRLVALTRGADGAILCTATHTVEVPGFPVTPVDTTGAGDGFVAALLRGLLQLNWQPQNSPEAAELEHMGRYACAVGAITCTGRGAIPALPDAATVERFLAGAAA